MGRYDRSPSGAARAVARLAPRPESRKRLRMCVVGAWRPVAVFGHDFSLAAGGMTFSGGTGNSAGSLFMEFRWLVAAWQQAIGEISRPGSILAPRLS